MVFAPTATVYHQHPNALISYVKKKFKFAFWRVLAVWKNPTKVVKDSHTPQLMKFQLLLAPTLPVALMYGFFRPSSVSLVAAVMLLFILTTLPFSLRAFIKDPLVGVLSPCLLAARAYAQFLGVVSGGLYVLFSSTVDLFAPATEGRR